MTEAPRPQALPLLPYTRISGKFTAAERDQLTSFLLDYLEQDTPGLRKTHYFNGRYENIYLDRQAHALLDRLVTEATCYAADLLDTSAQQLAVGFWVNRMAPGQSTTLHRHDDLDEMLSAVYYLHAPHESGDLRIESDGEMLEVEPVAGDYLFFAPTLPHAVSANRSDDSRISIGMNFGPAEPPEELEF